MASMNVQMSDLRDRITFQEPTITKAGSGAQTEAYANVATDPTVWAQIVYDHGQTVVTNEAEKTEQRATVTVRYRSDILSTWQILIDEAPWKLISDPDHVRGLNRWSVFRVERVKGTV